MVGLYPYWWVRAYGLTVGTILATKPGVTTTDAAASSYLSPLNRGGHYSLR